jgi:hypothetical protein
MFNILIIDKSAKKSFMKVMSIDNLYKKIGLKTEEGFLKHCEWNVTLDYYPHLYIQLYGKKIGKANNENKYNFPSPVDKEIFFGKCVLVAFVKNNNENKYISLTEELWTLIYLKLTTNNETIIDIPKNYLKKIKDDDLHLSSSSNDEEEDEEELSEEEESDDEEMTEDIKEESIEKIYLNNEIELIEELYLTDSDKEDDDDDDEDEDDEDEDEDDDEDDDLEYDDDDGDEVECEV